MNTILKAICLKTEGLRNPIGITFPSVRVSWKLEGEPDKRNQRQTSYQIICGSSPEELTEQRCLWNSGKVKSDETQNIAIDLPAKSRARIFWKVRVWDEEDMAGEFSNPAWFEQGLIDPLDWTAQWINPEGSIDPAQRQPASYLRKSFTLEKSAQFGRLYMTACGMYRCFLNGHPVDDQVLTPGTTQYDKRLQVQTYDVTELLLEGENVLAVILGDGWFRGMNGMQRNRNVYGDYIALLGQLEIQLSDGSKMRVITDESWKASQEGPIRFSDFMQGETYDANMELAGWAEGNFDDSTWSGVNPVSLNYETLIGSNSVPILERESFQSKLVYQNKNEAVLDFGQNISGYVSFTLNGDAATKGKTITLEHGEALDADGKFTMANLEGGFDPRTPPLLQKVTYVASDKETQNYKPLFSNFGFRYVKVTGWPGEIHPEQFAAHAVYSAVEQTGTFRCSNPLINRLVENTIWSQKGNFVDAPTDCPQRERAGYTGDAQVFVKTGSLLMDSLPFYRKWLADLRATQQENGKLSNIAPMQQKELAYFDGSAGWGDAIVIVPYTLYRQYGDPEILRENYAAMKAWVDFELKEGQKIHPINFMRWGKYKFYIWDTGRHWGEWLEPGQKFSYLIKRMYLGCPETATAYMFYSCKLLSEIAGILDQTADAEFYERNAQNIREAYRKFFLPEALKSKRQCLAVRPVFMDLADDAEKKELVQHLNDLVIENGVHLNTGFLSTPYICQVLADYGFKDTAYRLLEQEEMPGWLYPVKKGATTIWEKWDGVKEDGSLDSSLNHYSYGAIVGWLFEGIAGLRPVTPGWKRFTIAPTLGGSLTQAAAGFDSPQGLISSQWEIQGDTCRLAVDVPVNTTAEIILPVSAREQVLELPDGLELQFDTGVLRCVVGSGAYQFNFVINQGDAET